MMKEGTAGTRMGIGIVVSIMRTDPVITIFPGIGTITKTGINIGMNVYRMDVRNGIGVRKIMHIPESSV